MTGKNSSESLCPNCAAEHWGNEGDCSQPPLIELRDVWMGWNHRNILSDITLVIRKGDFIAITGPNGGGKTTLLRIVLGLLKPSRGKVVRCDTSLRIGYLPQKNMIDSHFPISVKEVIKSGLISEKSLSESEKAARYEQTVEEMGLSEQADKPIGVLSGGQLQRALLGRAVISRPDLLVLDEPLSYIDKRFENQLYKLIKKYSENCTIILVSHEMSKIAAMASRHFIVDGTLHACSAHHHYIYSECDE